MKQYEKNYAIAGTSRHQITFRVKSNPTSSEWKCGDLNKSMTCASSDSVHEHLLASLWSNTSEGVKWLALKSIWNGVAMLLGSGADLPSRSAPLWIAEQEAKKIRISSRDKSALENNDRKSDWKECSPDSDSERMSHSSIDEASDNSWPVINSKKLKNNFISKMSFHTISHYFMLFHTISYYFTNWLTFQNFQKFFHTISQSFHTVSYIISYYFTFCFGRTSYTPSR